MHKSTAVLVCGVALLASWAASGGQKTLGDGGWEASAAKAGLSAEDVRQLAGNKLLMTNEAYRQVFTPYLSRRLPVFVTSDSLLNAFHVLYEESVRRLEKSGAR